jgi:formamidopyrimidine-DNA glycosylase
MPELPEVETVRLQLVHKVVDKTIASVTVVHYKTIGLRTDFEARLTGKTIEHIDRVGKLLIWSFTGETNLFLLAHLKMTGQFFYVGSDGKVAGGGHSMTEADTRVLPNKHTRVSFHFSDSTTLHFNDMRIFGYIHIATAQEVEVARAKYGPEPIHTAFDVEAFTTALKKKSAPIKATLLDQSFIAGLGNIYVDEALWHAEVAPTRPTNTITKDEAARIAHFAGDVMNTSIKVGGTTFQHFVDTGGNNGNYTDYLKVFGKQGTPCKRCGTTIIKIRCAGRGTHYCPGCQI